MSDKQLLDLAADAAGLRIKDATLDENTGEILWLHVKNYNGDKITWQSWNPLTDDGDALRLAVKLDFCITQWRHYENAAPHVMVGYSTGPNHGANWIEDYNGDEMAANRRAIVCAAAEIGKAMP